MNNKELLADVTQSMMPKYFAIAGFGSLDAEAGYASRMLVVAEEDKHHEFWVYSPALQLMALEAYKIVWSSPEDKVRLSFNPETNELYMIEIFRF
ncbi:hypothetical protein [Pseudomonas putida]|uniref:hypothetical protein n=1 Tax=Pseudomonas putida TaxID=303 RepID=UPI001575DBFE|nr:hypothetical protein [Pseudomonas putida]MCC9006083.1 hypothetical protein [Pseudomonas putida]NTY93848.1 hypothetical protein [Pseudomonas putida]NTZ03947.1 hypothetical protein [Pseudomonas putida]NTZ24770.1 hypothetical protein [Pseudomonas putida]NTZ57286.1 hypothetical protein [Pseudomonas putida]